MGFRYAAAITALAGALALGAVAHSVALYDFRLTTTLLVVLVWSLRRPSAGLGHRALVTLWCGAERPPASTWPGLIDARRRGARKPAHVPQSL